MDRRIGSEVGTGRLRAVSNFRGPTALVYRKIGKEDSGKPIAFHPSCYSSGVLSATFKE